MRTYEDNHQLGSGCLAEHPHLLEMYARFIHGSEKKKKKAIKECVSTQDRWESVSREKNRSQEQLCN